MTTPINNDSKDPVLLADALPQCLRTIFDKKGKDAELTYKYKSASSSEGEIIIDLVLFLKLVISEAKVSAEVAALVWAAVKAHFKDIVEEKNGSLIPCVGEKTWGETFAKLEKDRKKLKAKLEKPLETEAIKWITWLLVPLRDPKKKPRQSNQQPGNQQQGNQQQGNQQPGNQQQGNQNSRQPDFTEKVLERDRYTCPVTGAINKGFKGNQYAQGTQAPRGYLEVAHIMPHHLNNGGEALKYYERFWSGGITAANFDTLVNDVSNGLPLDRNFHISFDKLEWSIEASATEYILRYTCNGQPSVGRILPDTTDGKKLIFGTGDATLAKPNRDFCNLHYAICRVANQSGMADVFNAMYKDDDEDLWGDSADPVFGDPSKVGRAYRPTPLDDDEEGEELGYDRYQKKFALEVPGGKVLTARS